jgi:hypothetical protein
MQSTPQQRPSLADQAAASPTALAAALSPQPNLPPLAEYVDLSGLLPSVQPTFPTLDSIRWFVRIHRETLARTGAVIALAGRLHYHPALFTRAAVEIGRNAAQPAEGGV